MDLHLIFFLFLGYRFEWREGKVWEVGRGFITEYVNSGEYIRKFLSNDRQEIESIWTGEHWFLEEDEVWIDGAYYRRGDRVFSVRDPGVNIELSAKAELVWWRLRMLGGRPVYRDDANMVRDAGTGAALFVAKYITACDAGFVIEDKGVLRFADGVREPLLLCESGLDSIVRILRVSNREYSITVGADRCFLLDAARWTCTSI